MVDRASFNSAWNSAVKNLPPAFGLCAAKPPVSDAELESKFALLKEETARTLALVRRLRTSPLYRMASIDPR